MNEAHEFMCTGIIRQIPDLDGPRLIAAYQFALIRMDDNVVDGGVMQVIPLYLGGSVRGSTVAQLQNGWGCKSANILPPSLGHSVASRLLSVIERLGRRATWLAFLMV